MKINLKLIVVFLLGFSLANAQTKTKTTAKKQQLLQHQKYIIPQQLLVHLL